MSTYDTSRFHETINLNWHAVLQAMRRKSIALLLITICGSAFAQGNAIESIDFNSQETSELVKIKLKNAITDDPLVNYLNVWNRPNKLILDFPHTSSSIDPLTPNTSPGKTSDAKIEQIGDSSRVILELENPSPPTIRVEGDSIIITTKDLTREAVHTLMSIEPPKPFAIHVKNIDSRSLLFLAADQGNLDVMAGDELKPSTLDVNESSTDGNQLIARIVDEQHLTTRTINNIMLIGSECRLAQTPNLLTQKGDQERASILFDDVPLVRLWRDVFVDMTPLDFTGVINTTHLTIRTKDKKIRDQLLAIATVEGWTENPPNANMNRLAPNALVEKCRPRSSNRDSLPISKEIDRQPLFSRSCPGLTWTGSVCSALEKYELKELKAFGYIQHRGSHSRIAIIKGSLGGIFQVLEGDEIGRNFGRVQSISDTGINIVERFLDSDGKWKDQRVFLNFAQ